MSAGNLKTEGLKGNNFPYQFKVLQILGMVANNTDQVEALLQAIEDNTDGVEGLLSQILAAVQSDKDFEASFIKDANGVIWLEVRTLDLDTNTWIIKYYAPGDLTAHDLQPGDPAGPLGPVVYESPASVLALILAELLDQGLTLDGIKTQTDFLTFSTGALNVALPSGIQSSRYVLTTGTAPVIVIAGSYELNVMNTGSDNITVDTGLGPEILKPGISLSWKAREGKTLGAFTFTGSTIASEFIYTAVI